MEKFNYITSQLKDVDAYLVPHNDAHQSEYIAECDERLAYVSNFTGSNGLGLILKDRAYLWTDSRYYIQAKKQLQEPWKMLKMEEEPWFNFVIKNIPKNLKIGYDPKLLTAQMVEVRQNFFQQNGYSFVPIEKNLIDEIWTDKPKVPDDKIFAHDKEFCGLHTIEKINKIKKSVLEKECNYLLTQKLDEIAWTLNLRGSDIEFNPVFFSFMILDFSNEKNKGTLFINKSKVTEEIKNYLQNECCIEVQEYDQIYSYLQNFKNGKILLSKSNINQYVFQQIKDQSLFQDCSNVIDLIKEVKSEREMQGMKDCHVHDGVALVQYLAWLEHELLVNKKQIDEFQAAQKAKQFRSEQKNNVGLSFETISSTGPNAAIIHYKPEEGKSSLINPEHIYLVDSGGQYKFNKLNFRDGTTDVTRTVHMSNPSQDEKKAFTLVLQGNLDIEMQVWPKDTPKTGENLDVLARKRLIENGMNYGHGTGHGVGYYLYVHEGPTGISVNRKAPFAHGMVVSNGKYSKFKEPGYYKEGHFGIRIENLIMCVEKGDNLSFINLTLCPYDRNLIDLTMCTKEEIDFINAYHKRCYEELSPILEQKNDQIALQWLKKHTQQL